jgi:hypothetical protein
MIPKDNLLEQTFSSLGICNQLDMFYIPFVQKTDYIVLLGRDFAQLNQLVHKILVQQQIIWDF